jgi:hypothetical protein
MVAYIETTKGLGLYRKIRGHKEDRYGPVSEYCSGWTIWSLHSLSASWLEIARYNQVGELGEAE